MGGVIFDYLSKVLPPGPKASKNIGAGLQSSFISFFLKKRNYHCVQGTKSQIRFKESCPLHPELLTCFHGRLGKLARASRDVCHRHARES